MRNIFKVFFYEVAVDYPQDCLVTYNDHGSFSSFNLHDDLFDSLDQVEIRLPSRVPVSEFVSESVVVVILSCFLLQF